MSNVCARWVGSGGDEGIFLAPIERELRTRQIVAIVNFPRRVPPPWLAAESRHNHGGATAGYIVGSTQFMLPADDTEP